MNKKRIQVVAAVIERNNQIFLAKRPDHLHQGGLWEFPGGKVENNETALDGLKRELFEEIDIKVTSAQPLIKINHEYPDKSVCLDVWYVTDFTGEAKGKEGQKVCWTPKRKLIDFKFPAANKSIVTATQLPQKYLITPEPALMEEQRFLYRLENAFRNGIQLAQLRTKKLSSETLSQLYPKAQQIAHSYNATLLLNCSIVEAQKLNVSYIHLSSKNLMSADSLPTHFFTAASCHNQQEVEKANSLGVDFIVIAPVNKTQSHPNTAPLGWTQFESLCHIAAVPAYALGGMREKEIQTVTNKGGQGIAAISALW